MKNDIMQFFFVTCAFQVRPVNAKLKTLKVKTNTPAATSAEEDDNSNEIKLCHGDDRNAKHCLVSI